MERCEDETLEPWYFYPPPRYKSLISLISSFFPNFRSRVTRRAAVAILAALLAAPSAPVPRPAFAAPAAVQGVAVVNVAYVIDASAPGKEGQKYLDGLKAKLEAELEDYKKSIAKDKNAITKTAEKEAELNEYFRAEFGRVTAIVSSELNRLCAEWLAKNASQASAVLPAHAVITVKPENDISRGILSQLNGVKINFAAEATERRESK